MSDMTDRIDRNDDTTRDRPARPSAAAIVRPTVRDLVAYHLDRHDVPIKLDQNENTFGPPAAVVAELFERLRGVALHRYPTPGQPELKRALAAANEWPAEGILVGNGSDDLLHTLAMAFLEPGRKAVAPTPSFFAYVYGTRLAGAEAIEVPMRGDLQYEPADLLAAIDAHAPHVVYLCSPNNPTGGVLTPSSIEEIAERAPGVVVLDEAYWEFAEWNGRGILDAHPNLLLFRTFSKALALAGARVGYVLGGPELVEQVSKAQQPYPVNSLSTEAALVALGHLELARERAREIVAERDRLFETLQGMPGVRVLPSKTNFLLFGTPLGSARTFEGLLERGVLVRDVSKHPLLAGLLRVGVGTPAENEAFRRALERTLEENRP
jgi:histidinol-phosphate aminotransferase